VDQQSQQLSPSPSRTESDEHGPATTVSSVVLERLIAEVRNDMVNAKGYDRTYNRHNR
jgi:hypothetical protein